MDGTAPQAGKTGRDPCSPMGCFGVPAPVTTLKYGGTSRVLPSLMDLEHRLGREIASILEKLEQRPQLSRRTLEFHRQGRVGTR